MFLAYRSFLLDFLLDEGLISGEEMGMATKLEQVEALTKELTDEERMSLAVRLFEGEFSIPNSAVESQWDAVSARRHKEILEGTVKCVDGDEVMAQLDAPLDD